MIWVGRISVALVGLFSLMMGAMALVKPAQVALALGFGDAIPALGLNTARADFGAFFLASAIACAGALFAGKTHWLWLPIFLYGLAAAGRIIGVLVDGAPAGIAQPIAIEIVIVALLFAGKNTLSPRS